MIVEALLVLILAALLLIIWKIFKGDKDSRTLALLEEKHRQMLVDVNDSLNKLSDRFNKTVTDELTATRESLQKLQLSQQESLSKIREDVIDKLHKTLSEQGKGQQESLQSSLKNTSLQLMKSLESLTKSVDERLQEITGKVHERLEEGFKKTNATFVSVMERLATIDEAQKKIEQEPVAFGLVALNIIFIMDEDQGSPDALEVSLATIEGVQGAEVTDVRRALG